MVKVGAKKRNKRASIKKKRKRKERGQDQLKD